MTSASVASHARSVRRRAAAAPSWPVGDRARARARPWPRRCWASSRSARASGSPSTSRFPTSRLPGRSSSALLSAGHEVIVPVVLDDFSLEWRMPPGRRRRPGTVTRRPRTPPPPSEAGVARGGRPRGCDLIVTPGLSVDRHGTRLGPGRRLLRPGAAAPGPGRTCRHPAPRGRGRATRTCRRRARRPSTPTSRRAAGSSASAGHPPRARGGPDGIRQPVGSPAARASARRTTAHGRRLAEGPREALVGGPGVDLVGVVVVVGVARLARRVDPEDRRGCRGRRPSASTGRR